MKVVAPPDVLFYCFKGNLYGLLLTVNMFLGVDGDNGDHTTTSPTESPKMDTKISLYTIFVTFIIPLVIIITFVAFCRRRNQLLLLYQQNQSQNQLLQDQNNMPRMNLDRGHSIVGQDGHQYSNDGTGHYFTADRSRHMIIDRNGMQYYGDRLPIAKASIPIAPVPDTLQRPNQANNIPTAIAYPMNYSSPDSTNYTNDNTTTTNNNNIDSINNREGGGERPSCRYGEYRNSDGILLAGGAMAGFAAGVTAEDCKYLLIIVVVI